MDYTDEILIKIGIGNPILMRKHLASHEVYLEDLIFALINTTSIAEASSLLGRTNSSLTKWLSRNKHIYFPLKDGDSHWRTYLYSLIGRKYCPECKSVKYYNEYYKNPNQAGGLTAVCSTCQNNLESARQQLEYFRKNKLARTVGYQLRKQKAVPNWADLSKIKEIYTNCPKGMHVDHIIPLNGDLVCGLHIHTNLQYLTPEENIRKSNKFDIES